MRNARTSGPVGVGNDGPFGRRDGGGQANATTLDAPQKARKAFAEAAKELAKPKPKLNKAAKEFEKAVSIAPSYAEAWFELGEVRVQQKRPDEARGAFEKAWRPTPSFTSPTCRWR